MIAIAGGGIGGLGLAVALQQQGHEVVVLERQPEIRDTGAGISLWPNALAALDSVGLGATVRSIGRQLSSGGLRKADGGTAVRFSARSFEAALGEGLVCVHRGELVATLAGMLRPGTIRAGRAVTGYEPSGTGVRVQLATGDGPETEEVQAEALVGADGIHSAVAAAMAGPLGYRYSGYTAWRGIAQIDADPEGEGIWACLPAGHEVGWLPITSGRTYWFATACLPPDYRFPEGDRAYLTQAFAPLPHPVPALLRATPEGQLVRSDIVDREMPSGFSRGPVTVIGDAAHPMRPHMGQGGCQALEDVAALAACLANHSDPATAFERYERIRRRRVATVVKLSRRSGFTRPPGRATSAADRLTALLPGVPIGAALWGLSPIAGYRAGVRATQVAG